MALSIPAGDEDQSGYKATLDNTAASFGKIIKGCSEFMEAEKTKQLVEFWLYKLPLVKDKDEGRPQHLMLCEILVNKPDMILGASNEHLAHVLKIFLTIYGKKSSNPETDVLIQNIMKNMSTNEVIVAAMNLIPFTDDQKAKIQKIVVAVPAQA